MLRVHAFVRTKTIFVSCTTSTLKNFQKKARSRQETELLLNRLHEEPRSHELSYIGHANDFPKLDLNTEKVVVSQLVEWSLATTEVRGPQFESSHVQRK